MEHIGIDETFLPRAQPTPAALQEFDIDTERLPLGTLSKDQVQRGYDVLERLRSALNGSGDSLERLSSEFYQVPGVPFCRPLMTTTIKTSPSIS